MTTPLMHCSRSHCRGVLLPDGYGGYVCHLCGRALPTDRTAVQQSLFEEPNPSRPGRPPGRRSEWISLRGSR
jgi:hypothetical protein